MGAYVYPAATAPRPHAPSTVAGTGLTYDDNGNMTTGFGAKVMTWDAENRPLSVTWAGVTTDYEYGADGSRLKMTVTDGASVETTLYVGDVEIRNYGTGAAEIVTRHLAPDIREVNGVQSLLVRDHLGSVILSLGATGLAARETAYAPYGSVAAETVLDATVATETKGYIGERLDRDAGLQYLNARYYDPTLALFTSPDWWEVTEQGVGTNRYAYVGGDPVNMRDPGGNAKTASQKAQLASFLENDSNWSVSAHGHLFGLEPGKSARDHHRDAGSFFLSDQFGGGADNPGVFSDALFEIQDPFCLEGCSGGWGVGGFGSVPTKVIFGLRSRRCLA